MRIVDAQIHLWGSGLPSNMAHRQVTSFTTEEAVSLMDEGGVDAAVIHPPGWDPNSTEMAFKAVRDYPGRFAILGSFPLSQPDKRAIVETWRSQPGMLGLRYTFLQEPMRGRLADGTLDWLWAAAERAGVPIAMLATDSLAHIGRIAERHPGLRLTIDHLGGRGGTTTLKDDAAMEHMPALVKLARHPNVAVKATGAPGYCSGSYPFTSMHTYLRQIYDSIWATEHYGSAYSMQPNPLQYLAYWAGRTRRVDVGTAVIVAPWWNPVRLASEISMLDILLQGRRLHLGIGRGISPHEYASLGYPIGESHAYFYDVIGALKASDGAERFTFDGKVYKIPPTTIRPQARHTCDLTTRIQAPFTTEASARMAAENGLGQMFVAGAGLDEMTAQVRRFNTIRTGMGLPPDQPTTLLWMYCAETASEAEEGWEYFHNQLLAAQHHYFEWNNPGYAGIPGYEEYLKRQTADVGVADAGLAARRATQPIGTPDEIIEKIRTLQHAISLEMIVVHFFYGGMPKAEAENSLRLFAEKVLPAVQAMPTPINAASLGV